MEKQKNLNERVIKMTPEIKQRIDQIRQGEIPEEYQKKCVGIIPQNWNKSFLGAIIKELSSGVSVNSDVTIDTGVYVLKTSSISEGKVDLRESKPIIPGDLKRVRCPVLQGTILISRMNTPMLVGECGYVNEGSDIHYLPDRLWQAINRSEKICNFKWLNYLLNSDRYRTAIHTLGTGTSNSMKNISKEDFLTLPIAFPPLLEQQKIAEILTAQDKVIELKEKLLNEKQRQKKYLMQQLLTGKKRLPGFSGEWKRMVFDDVFTFSSTNTFSREYMCEESTGIKNIHYGDILVRYREILKLSEQKIPSLLSEVASKITSFVDDGDIVIADTAEDLTAGKVVEVQETQDEKVASGLHTMLCKPIKGCFASGWLGYFMNSDYYHKQLIPYIAGVKVMSISKGNIVKTHILVPCIQEQTAIVKILSTADREIELLQKDIEQEKQKKKALMQLLLTGIVRV